MNRTRRNVFLPVTIGVLLLSMVMASGCCRRCVGTKGTAATTTDNSAGTEHRGVTVTKEVPHANETISDIEERERTNPLPERGDTAIHSHKIPRTGIDNDSSIPPGDVQPLK